MLPAQEQVVEIVKEEENEIVELSQADLQWIGGGGVNMDGTYDRFWFECKRGLLGPFYLVDSVRYPPPPPGTAPRSSFHPYCASDAQRSVMKISNTFHDSKP